MATVGQRPDIEGKIGLIADRIVRARLAKKNRAIMLSRIRTGAAVLGSTLTTIGLTNPLVSLLSGKGNQSLDQAFSVAWFGLPKIFSFVGVGVFIATAIALAFYKQAKIDEKAIQSLGLVEAFVRLELDFERNLEQAEPIQQLNAVYNSAIALETSNFLVMPRRNGHKNLVDSYVQTTIRDYCRYWDPNPPAQERRERL
jgi:hypothetical protein